MNQVGCCTCLYEMGIATPPSSPPPPPPPRPVPAPDLFRCGGNDGFSPRALLANPRMLVCFGAAAQFGIFATLLGAVALNWVPGIEFTIQQAGCHCDYWWCGCVQQPFTLASQLAPELLGAIAVAAYSYMALVPVLASRRLCAY